MAKHLLSLTGILIALSIAPTVSARVIPDTQRVSSREVHKKAEVEAEERGKRRMATIITKKTFQDSDSGVSVQYPSNWQVDDRKQEEDSLTLVVLFLGPDTGSSTRQNINLVTEDLSDTPGITLEEYTQLGIQKERDSLENYDLISSSKVTAAGRDAHRIIFDATYSGIQMRFEQVWYLYRNTAHVWTFADLQDLFPTSVNTFESMMETVSLAKEPDSVRLR